MLHVVVVNMAESDFLVTISGAALSLLFFENVRSIGNQIGFLLGEALEFVVKTYTDSDNQVETIKMHINVETVVTCPLSEILHDSNHISKKQLKDFVRDKGKNVIGWFRFRRNTNCLIPSLKDKLLHKQLALHFAGGDSCKEESFLTCLLNASTSETHGTHKFRHVFFRRKQEVFEPISLRINNLGDDASRHDGSDYKPIPTKKSIRVDGFSKLVESLNLNLMRGCSGLESAMTIQHEANAYLGSLIPKVCETDLEVAKLEEQVRELRVKIKSQQLAKRLKANGENFDKETREAASLEKIESSQINEAIGSDVSHLQKDYISPCRISYRNTAACIAKSVSQEKSHQPEINTDDHQTVQERSFLANADITSGTNRNQRMPDGIPEIVAETICPEGNIAMYMGRGRGSGSRAHEFNPGMRKARRAISSTSYSSHERSVTPEQDFSDVQNPQKNSILPTNTPRSYNQSAKKNSDNSCNAINSIDI